MNLQRLHEDVQQLEKATLDMHIIIHQPWETTKGQLAKVGESAENEPFLHAISGLMYKAFKRKEFALIRRIFEATNRVFLGVVIRRFLNRVCKWHTFHQLVTIFVSNDPDDNITTRLLEKIGEEMYPSVADIAGLFEHYSVDSEQFVGIITGMLSFNKSNGSVVNRIFCLIDPSDKSLLKESIKTRKEQKEFLRYYDPKSSGDLASRWQQASPPRRRIAGRIRASTMHASLPTNCNRSSRCPFQSFSSPSSLITSWAFHHFN